MERDPLKVFEMNEKPTTAPTMTSQQSERSKQPLEILLPVSIVNYHNVNLHLYWYEDRYYFLLSDLPLLEGRDCTSVSMSAWVRLAHGQKPIKKDLAPFSMLGILEASI